jgi:hypothetical protein
MNIEPVSPFNNSFIPSLNQSLNPLSDHSILGDHQESFNNLRDQRLGHSIIVYQGCSLRDQGYLLEY